MSKETDATFNICKIEPHMYLATYHNSGTLFDLELKRAEFSQIRSKFTLYKKVHGVLRQGLAPPPPPPLLRAWTLSRFCCGDLF